jgi:tetratricopeptide (TPR) repeat protein
MDPTDADAYCNRGVVLVAKGDYKRGIADFTEAIQKKPGLSRAFYVRGRTLLEHGETDAGDADIAHAIELEPEAVFLRPIYAPYLGVPSTAKEWPLTASTKSPGARLFLYTLGVAHPVRFDAPASTKTVPLNGPDLYLVAVPDTAEWKLQSPPVRSDDK